MDKIYCLVLFPALGKGFGLNRKYELITEDREVWGKVTAGEIVEADTRFFPPLSAPKWAYNLQDAGHLHVAFWTNV